MVTVAATPVAEGWECAVEVAEGGGRTSHTVTVRPRDIERWGRPAEAPEQLVVRAFEFLLAREPAGSILRRFEVSDISRYFPEFDREMRA